MIEDKQKNPSWDHTTDNTEQQTVVSRSERNQQRKRKPEKEEPSAKGRIWVQVRIIPIWLRIILVLLLLGGAVALGTTIGYGYIGDGNPEDALKKETWIHIIDIIKGKES
ncbi:DNA-directed RNA polymerase subunit beta [Sporosarcina thermotolerans]|uniref:DNA-directed RNA polymerase subunit beta n=1 Tax=Sporosarcina thermotolerans TaxID=633404 RepID=A0AAW9A8Z2_9BACL|nr:DNA-directed RNA polymerase subunit beta [Sporosarcina thermotolerans]MDW0116365.1 DNA-directed RNA polymerase subunit beta [Sporosarcina thermotolerans]WHT48327.1 DNA-directed RNA polymerase subunit beta [Sporosarcina thermotolerans]